MADSPHEYVEQLRARVASLEAALKLSLDEREQERAQMRLERAEWRAEVERLTRVVVSGLL